MRWGWSTAGALLAALVIPGVASAHVRIGTLAVDVHVRVSAADGPFAASVSDGNRAVHVTVRSGHRLTVLGYLGEPMVRLDRRGVAVDLASPTAAAAGLVPKSRQTGDRGWLLDRGARTAVWRDPRLQSPLIGSRRAAWAIPVVVDGRRTRISGELVRVRRPGLWPWLLVVLGSLSVGLAAVRTRVQPVCLALGSAAAILSIVTLTGFALEAGAVGTRVGAVYELVFAAGGAGFALFGPAEVRVAAAGWLGLLGLIGGLVCTPVFLHGVVLSTLPAALTRTGAALAVGLGAASVMRAGLFYARLPERR